MAITSPAIRELDTVTCLHKLEGHPVRVGILAVVRNGAPELFPVNYHLDAGVVTFRTAAGTKLDAMLNGSAVALAVTEVDPAWQDGWSVVVHGKARLVADPTEAERASRTLHPWAGGFKPFVFQIDADAITGRQLC